MKKPPAIPEALSRVNPALSQTVGGIGANSRERLNAFQERSDAAGKQAWAKQTQARARKHVVTNKRGGAGGQKRKQVSRKK